jgi:replicative DNA helicase Mcm
LKPDTPDPSINQRVAELSKDPDLIQILTQSFAPSIHGLEKIKLAILYHLVGGVPKERNGLTSRGALHVLLIGDPGTGKTQLLQFAQSLFDAVSVTGTGVNREGFAATVTIDQTGAPTILEGALVKADNNHLHIDKLDKLNSQLVSVLETAMEQQIYPISKNGLTTCLKTRISVLAASNPTLGRYNSYQTIAQNINLPVGILTCFDLIFILRDCPDEETDRLIAEKILEIEPCRYEDEPMVEHILLKAYLTKASKIQPTIPRESKNRIRDFYIDIRRASEDGGAITITPRQLISLVRISEAHAKLHLRDKVHIADVETAIKVFKKSLEQVGIDPVSHHYDIDVLYTGRPTIFNSKLFQVVEIFSELEKISATVSEMDLHNTLFERYGMTRRTVARLIRTLIKEEIIKTKTPGYFKRTK